MAATTQPAGSNLSAQIDLLISLHLWAWPALTLAIQNAWGGSPQVSRDKRDWLAGAVSELVTSEPAQLHDVSDLEEVLLQVMVDEFEVVVDDGSAEETAGKIWKGVERLRAGDVAEVQELYERWVQRQGKGEQKVNITKGHDQEAEDTDWDDDDEEEEEWNGFADEKNGNGDVDVDMGDAPPLPKQKIEPEIDEDGFTKVVGKKNRR
ncbi:hypothetical protein DV735_g5138, partial [Chaetothyriales sp. CBS 134920]